MTSSSTQSECTQLFSSAYDAQATDVHFHPDIQHTSILFRIEGKLKTFKRYPRKKADQMIAHLKFQSGMDIGEHRLPQNGALAVAHARTELAIRLSTIPIPNGERLVARILPQGDGLELSQLALHAHSSEQLHDLLYLPHGLLLFTGPTGSGKTTTMYALMQEFLKTSFPHIISVEDPIEKPQTSFTQMQVNEQAGLFYTDALKAALRHDPDILMIGEIRDEDTAQIAVRAAMTGRLVLTTMHTRNTTGALVRLLEFGVPGNYLYESIAAVVSQRLVEVSCTESDPDTPFIRKAVFSFLEGEDLRSLLQNHVESLPVVYDGQVEKLDRLSSTRRERSF